MNVGVARETGLTLAGEDLRGPSRAHWRALRLLSNRKSSGGQSVLVLVQGMAEFSLTSENRDRDLLEFGLWEKVDDQVCGGGNGHGSHNTLESSQNDHSVAAIRNPIVRISKKHGPRYRMNHDSRSFYQSQADRESTEPKQTDHKDVFGVPDCSENPSVSAPISFKIAPKSTMC